MNGEIKPLERAGYQAMKVSLLAEENAGYFFRQSVKAVSIVEMDTAFTD